MRPGVEERRAGVKGIFAVDFGSDLRRGGGRRHAVCGIQRLALGESEGIRETGRPAPSTGQGKRGLNIHAFVDISFLISIFAY